MADRRGLLMVYTGNGKGKTTAAMGLALRAAGQGLRCLMLQFIKGSWHYGELDGAKMLGGLFEIRPLGKGFVKIGAEKPLPEDIQLAGEGWAQCVAAMHSGAYDLLIFDELNNALHYGLLDPDHVLEDLRQRPPRLHIVVTGRGAPQQLIEAADMVTEVRMVKHHYHDQKIRAQPGIEY